MTEPESSVPGSLEEGLVLGSLDSDSMAAVCQAPSGTNMPSSWSSGGAEAASTWPGELWSPPSSGGGVDMLGRRMAVPSMHKVIKEGDKRPSGNRSKPGVQGQGVGREGRW